MKPGYRELLSASCKLSYCQQVEPHLRGGLRVISHVKSVTKRQGHATALIRSICAQADDQNIALMLNPHAEEENAMTDEQLKDWYAKFGFSVLQESPVVLMVRMAKIKDLAHA